MATFKTGVKVSDKGTAEGRKQWEGEIPPSGSYSGILRTVAIKYIGDNAKPENRGKPKFLIGVELTDTVDGKYDGYTAWGHLNLIDGSEAFINQFLLALTDGSDKQFAAIKAAFDKGFVTDERKKHVLKIGRVNINSPKGELPIKISLKATPWFDEKTKRSGVSTDITSYLSDAEVSGGSRNGSSGPEVPEVEEEELDDSVDVDADEELDDDDDSADEELLED
jgi:hypothetical protein